MAGSSSFPRMAHSSLLLLTAVIFRASFPTEAVVNNCTGGCECEEITGNEGVHAKCTLSDWKELSTFILRPLDVKSLEIFLVSEVQTVDKGSFKNFTNLVKLDLSNNSIVVIRDSAFSDLNYLQSLDLSSNQLERWEGNFANELSPLMYLNISRNPDFRLPAALLKLRMLKEIRGVTWNEPCANCILVRNYTLENGDLNNENINITTPELMKGEYIVGKKENCRVNTLTVSKEVVEYAKHGFFPRCLEEDSRCFTGEVRVTPTHRCWDLDNKILNAVYLTAPVAMILNLTVVIISLTTRTLRRNVTMLLTSNMAVSDFLLSLYTVTVVTARQTAYTDFLLIQNDLCNVMGFIWLTGQIVSIKTSLLLTAERFLAIVYCMQPAIRITRKLAVIFATLTWCLGVAVAVLPLAKISVYTSNTYCIPIRPIKDIPHSYELSIGLSLWGMLLYFITVPFYVKIYFSVKKTSQRAGVKRDGTLARRIGTLVLSNMLFFFVPIVIAFLWLTTNLKETMSPQNREILTGVVPTLLFSFNALINPLLYAFRGEKFRKAIKMRINTILLRKPRGASLSESYQHQVSSRKRNSTLTTTPPLSHRASTVSQRASTLGTPPLLAKFGAGAKQGDNGIPLSRI